MKAPAVATLRETLAPLVAGLAEALLPWVERLDLALGPLAAEEPEADGDPDGFLGLSRRGPYERLLLSEWLLATEAPDEFVRRAAAGEHSFLELARRSEAGSRVTAVFFDAGPWQVGAPRLAHLALLLLMARRAQAAGARFFWGVLQSPGALRSATSAEQVAAMMGARSRLSPTASMLEAWAACPELAQARRELWLVGGPSIAPIAPGPFVEIDEPLDASGPARLTARVRRPDRAELAVDLVLPPEAEQIQALREPFRRRAPAQPARRRGAGKLALGDRASLFFSPNGRRLFAGTEGGFLSHTIPNSPYATPASDVLIHEAPGVLAAGLAGKRVIALQRRSAHEFRVLSLGRRGGESAVPRDIPSSRFIEPTSRPLMQLFSAHWSGEVYFAFDAPSGVFLSLRHEGAETSEALCASFANHRLLVGRSIEGKEGLHFFAEEGRPSPAKLATVAVDHEGKVFFGGAEGALRHPELGLCAVERRSYGDWAVFCSYHGAPYLPMAEPRGGSVVGVVHGPLSMLQAPALLVLSDDRKILSACGPSSSVELARSEAPIAAVASSTGSPCVAYSTEDHELIVLSRTYPNLPLLKVLHGR